MKRFLSLALVALLALSSFALAEDPITVYRSGTGMPSVEDDALLPNVLAAMDFDVSFECVPAEYTTQLNARLFGGDVPDIFEVPYDLAPTFIDQGLVLNIEPYLDQLPNLVAKYNESAMANCYMKGGMYLIAGRPYIAYAEEQIRKDWLDNLGLTMPTTLDELHKVLTAFTFNDPDGNGKNDTYGLSGSHLNTFNSIFLAYGTSTPGRFLIKDNELVFTSIDPNMKEAIIFIKQLIDEGVVDPEVMSVQASEHRDKAIAGSIGMLSHGFWEMFKATYMDQVKAINPNAEWVLMPAVEGPGGKYDAAYDSSNASGYFGINAELADDPERLAKVLKLIDWMCTEDGQRGTLFGTQGIHYELDENGNIVPLDALSQITYSWLYCLPGRDDLPYLKAKFSYLLDEIDFCGQMNTLPFYNSKVSIPDNVNVADISTYAEEEITRFIYGERPIEEWDEYVDTICNVFGLNAYLESAKAELTEKEFLK